MKERLLQIFQNKYNRADWQQVLIEVFGAKELLREPQVLDDDEYARSYELGHLLTSDIYDIGFFEYELKAGRKVEKGPAGLRNLVKKYLKYNVDAAIVVYHDAEHWRLSFISDLKGETTDPKRFTYVFGDPVTPYKTPIERFEGLAKTDATFAHIYEAFSVKKLDNDFFNGYKDLYAVFCKYAPDTKEYRDYIKRMMGRLVFLHFLQKKGWLGGDPNYMTNLLERSREEYSDTFLSEVLSVLFFDTLNERRENDAVDPVLGEGVTIPYLNGGLFERDAMDQRGVDFPFENFQWLFYFFSSFNFTVDENAPGDAEIGVDPEMLGHIFENLLEDNKDKGAYYTPMEVVQYMCRDSIAQFLKANAPDVPEADIEDMVYRYDMTWMMFEEKMAKPVINLIRNIKVCDPSIGSGAFPMGMLNELYNIRQAIYDFYGRSEEVTPYILKRDIIRNNIYGVDIDQGAVDIARLRFWLALVVEDTEKRPLPNLDYKIMQGNSLLESFWGVDLSLYFDDKDGKRLHEYQGKQGLIKAYFGESDHDKKNDLRKCIEDRVSNHIYEKCRTRPAYLNRVEQIDPSDRPFFLWRVYFSDIFDRAKHYSNGGFDILIGNPPYGATSTDNDKRQYKREYRTTRTLKGRHQQKGSQDTYSIFIEQGYNQLAKNGILSFIVPISVTSSDSMIGLHRLLLNNCKTIKISSYSRFPKPIFENAMVSVSILSLVKTNTPCEGVQMTKTYRRKNGTSLEQLLNKHQFAEVGNFVLKGRFPKISEEIEKDILSKLFAFPATIGHFIRERGEPIFYRTTGGGKFEVITNYPTGSTKEKPIYFDRHIRNLIGAILSSNLYSWFYQAYSNDRDLKSYEIESFPFPIEDFSEDLIDEISIRYKEYLVDIESNALVRQTKAYRNIESFKEYKIHKSKVFIDRIDDLIGPVYGLSEEEIKFIKDYEIEFRVPDNKSKIVE